MVKCDGQHHCSILSAFVVDICKGVRIMKECLRNWTEWKWSLVSCGCMHIAICQGPDTSLRADKYIQGNSLEGSVNVISSTLLTVRPFYSRTFRTSMALKLRD